VNEKQEKLKLVGLLVGAVALIILKPALAAGIFLFGVVVALHEAGHMFCAKRAGMRVDTFSVGLGPALWKFQHGETEYRIAPIPFGGYVHIVGLDPEEEGAASDPRAFDNRPLWARALAIFGGPLANYITAMILIIIVMFAYGGQWAVGVVSVRDGAPAAEAGLLAGDRILAINGERLSNVGDLGRLAGAKGNYALTIRRKVQVSSGFESLATYRKGDKLINPAKLPSGEQDITFLRSMSKPAGLFGIGVSQALIEGGDPSVSEVLMTSVRQPLQTSLGIGASLVQALSAPKSGGLGGPVAILKQASDEAQGGLLRFLLFAITLSIALGFFNLLPIPALDGGRLVFLALEAISPKLLPSPALQMRIHSYGFAGLLGLIVLLTVFDVKRLL
jgi:regulator of sigma E protease